MNLQIVTIQDCIDMYQFKGQSTIINDGEVVGFEQEKKDIDLIKIK